MTWETVLYEKIDEIAKLTLNRPEKRNAQNMRLIAELDEACRAADRDPEVRVIVLCGAGKSFSASSSALGTVQRLNGVNHDCELCVNS